jgi:hypothetical protein
MLCGSSMFTLASIIISPAMQATHREPVMLPPAIASALPKATMGRLPS